MTKSSVEEVGENGIDSVRDALMTEVSRCTTLARSPVYAKFTGGAAPKLIQNDIAPVLRGMRPPASDDEPTSSYVDSLAYAAPSIEQRRVATSVAIAAIVVFFGTVPFAAIGLPHVSAFLPSVTATAVFGTVLTALILGSQYRATRYPPLGFLALAYAIESTLVIVYVVTFPHLFGNVLLVGSGPQSAAWLYPAWHGGFFVCLGAYCVSCARMRGNENSIARDRCYVAPVCVVATIAVGAILYLAILRSGALPTIVLPNGHFTFVATRIVEPALLVIDAALLFILIRWTRLAKMVDLWIVVTLVAFACETMLAEVFGDGRYTVGWYVASVEWCAASVAFPIALVAQMSEIIAGLSTANRSLVVASDTDSLTGLYNRRGFDVRFKTCVFASARAGKAISLVIIDVDEFKKFNDTFGHPGGDAALQEVAQVLQRAITPPLEFASRIGGEEFAIVLPDTNADGAVTLAEHVRTCIEALAIAQYPGSVPGRLTVSIGVASSPAIAGEMHQDLMTRADHALYVAKRSGRNRTHLAA